MADGVSDAVHDGWDDRDPRDFGHALRRLVVRQRRQDFGGLRPYRHVAAARQMIAIEIPGAVARTVLVEREPFVQRQADAGGGRALDLARHQLRVCAGSAGQRSIWFAID